MTLTQNWVGYLDRSYEQIKQSLINRLVINTPEITDHTENNPLIIILSMFAGVAEMLNLYIDSMAKEAFLGTARRYSSLIKLSRLIDYSVKAKNYSTADVLFSLRDSNGDPTTSLGDIIIVKNTLLVASVSNIPFRVINDIIIPAGSPNNYGAVGQYIEVIGDILGMTNGSVGQIVSISSDYVHKSMTLTIDGEIWNLYNSFGLMSSSTKGFIINIDEEGLAFIQFGDGINGKIPLINKTIFGDYKTSLGSLGNVPPNSINTITFTGVLPLGLVLVVTNPDYSNGGTDFESIEDIRNRAPRSLRTLERAVTYQDYIDLALLVPGVGAAEVRFCCGKFISLYIVPSTTGIATTALLNQVRDYMECKKMITTQIDYIPAGITKIWVKGKIYGKPLALSTALYNQTVDALDKEFGFSKVQINRKISISDITAVVEGISIVDHFDIEQVRILPYPRPIEGNTHLLNLQILSLPVNAVRRVYTLIYNTSLNSFEVYKDGFFLTSLAVGTPLNDGGNITFQINAGTYSNGDKWEFTAFPSYPEIFPDTLLNTNDYSAPIIEVGPLLDNSTPRTFYGDLQIITQAGGSNCLPPCS